MRQIIPRAIQKIEKLPAEQIHNLFLSMAQDIERLETVLDSLAEGIFVCDTDNNLILANKYSDRLLPMQHYSTDETAPIWNVIKEEKVADFLRAALSAGDKVEDHEFDVESKGIQRLLSLSVFPLVKDYQVCGSLIHVDDITEKRSREARLHRMESLASLTTLAAGVAHEIKNPLGSISIQIQLLQKTMKKNEELYYSSHPEDRPDPNFTEKGPVTYFTSFNKHLAVINEEIERLNHIVVDFLFAVRPIELNLREADINSFLGEMADFVRYEIENSHVEIKLSLDDDLPLLDFDGRLMKQALLNLIQNAAAAMKDGGTLTLRTERRDNEAAISVCDTGTGISPKNLSKIFEPYFTTKEQGSGLGLTLVFKIVREHHGEISVKSKEGKGSCFTITLPIPQKNRKMLPAVSDYVNEIVLVEGGGS
jgi:PAS domain S-box-containing protein